MRGSIRFVPSPAASHLPVANHLAALHPDWVRSYAGSQWFDPGEPGVRTHALSVIRDVVRRYDVDGVHIDDYFYPYPKGSAEFPDDVTFERYGDGKDRQEWRRGNTNAFVSAFYQAVKFDKPSVKVGISPFGIWRPGHPAGVRGLDSYEAIAADSRLWLHEGWCDYLTPQLYWRIDSPRHGFASLLEWWQGENLSQRCIWPGMSTAQFGASPRRKTHSGEIVKQIELARAESDAASGHVHWSIGSLRRDRGGIVSRLKKAAYKEKALVPATPWLGSETPPVPFVSFDGDVLRVEPSGNARWFVFQALRDGKWETSHVVTCDCQSFKLPAGADAVAVRSQSPSGVLSPAVVVSRSSLAI